jgi:hypothetical protein
MGDHFFAIGNGEPVTIEKHPRWLSVKGRGSGERATHPRHIIRTLEHKWTVTKTHNHREILGIHHDRSSALEHSRYWTHVDQGLA